MASPTRYELSYSFADFQTANPSTPLPADKLEIEFNNLTLTTDEIITNLDLIQRSDGALKNQIVSFDALSNDVKVLLGSAITPKGAWLTATAYVQLDLVTESGSTYLAASNHTSGTFATDLAAGKWILWAASNSVIVNNSNWSGTDLAVTNGGTGVSTLTGLVKGNGTSAFTAAVQGTDYYKPGGTDVALADGGTGASTASGARTNLGLGALAVLNTVDNDDWSGVDLSIANGGTGASTAADARTALDVYSKGESGKRILQHSYKSTTTNDSTALTIPDDNTIPQNTECKVGLTADAFTPTSATSKLRISYSAMISNSSASTTGMLLLFKDSDAGALKVSPALVGNGDPTTINGYYEMVAGTTSPITFKLYFGGLSNTTYFLSDNGTVKWGGVVNAHISIEEIVA